jgi:hypothetical protein
LNAVEKATSDHLLYFFHFDKRENVRIFLSIIKLKDIFEKVKLSLFHWWEAIEDF